MNLKERKKIQQKGFISEIIVIIITILILSSYNINVDLLAENIKKNLSIF